MADVVRYAGLGGRVGVGRSGEFVSRVLYALAAKSSVPSVLSTLLTARKDAIKASIVSYNAPRIVYVCLGLCREQRG
jgi:hypothetical protein